MERQSNAKLTMKKHCDDGLSTEVETSNASDRGTFT